MNLFRRWLKFNAVGAIGIGVQLGTLALLLGAMHMNYLVATALAVEIAVLHNFCWHAAWTWRDRTRAPGGAGLRLLRFHLGNGFVSLAANLGLMRLLVGRFHMQYLLANLVAIAAGSLANFAVSHWLVFSAPRRAGAEFPASAR